MELLIVLIIAGVLGAVAYPRLDTSRYRADAVVMNVRGALQQAQRYALVRQHDVIVTFDTVGNRIRIGMDGNNDLVLSQGELILNKSLETGNAFRVPPAGLNGAVAASVKGPGMRIFSGIPGIVFHRDGSSSSDVEIYLSSPAKGSAYTYRAVLLVQSTGRTEWYRWNTETNKWSPASL
jgi:Tfp pilus assembly protein FimT